MSTLRLVQSLEEHRDRQYRRGALQTALDYGVVSREEWTALMRRYVNPIMGDQSRRRGRTRFNEKRNDYFWEKEAEAGREFLGVIAAKPFRDHWSSVVRSVSRSGVLAWQYHHHVLGILAAPPILWSVLRGWREGRANRYPQIAKWLLELLPTTLAPACERLRQTTWGLGTQPKSIARLADDLHREGGIVLVTRHRQPYAFLVTLDALTALHHEAEFATTWGAQALSWISHISTTA